MATWDDFPDASEQPVVPVVSPKAVASSDPWDSFPDAGPTQEQRAYNDEIAMAGKKAYEETGPVGRSLPSRILIGTAGKVATGITLPILTAAKYAGIPGAEKALASEYKQRDVEQAAMDYANEQSGRVTSILQQAGSGLGDVAFKAAMPGGLIGQTAVTSGTENLTHEKQSLAAGLAKTAIDVAAMKIGPLGKLGSEAEAAGGSLLIKSAKGAAEQTAVGAGQHAAEYLVDVADGKHPYDGAELRDQLTAQVPINMLMGAGGEIIHHVANAADVKGAEIESVKKENAATPPPTEPVTKAAGGIPPVAPGMVRFYHGGDEYNGGSRFITPDLEYAKGYASGRPNAFVHYVDIPEGHPVLEGKKAFDYSGSDVKSGYVHFDAPEEIASQLKRFNGPAGPHNPLAQPPPGGLDLEPNWLDETSPKHAFVDEDREIMDLVELDRGDSLSFAEALRQAREQNIPERATDIAAAINLRPDKSATPVEVAGLTIRLAQLKNEYAAADDNANAATNEADKISYALEAERLKSEADVLQTAASGSPAGRRLSFQRLSVDRSTDLLPVIRRTEVAKGEELTEPEKAKIRTFSKRGEKLRQAFTNIASNEKPVADPAGLLSKVLGDIGNFHTDSVKNAPASKTELDGIAVELQRLVSGAKTKPEKTKAKERPLTDRERIVELQKKIDNLPEGALDSTNGSRLESAIGHLKNYYDSKSKNVFLENIAKQFGRKLTEEEHAKFSQFYDELGTLGQKLADQRISREKKAEIDYQMRRLQRDIQDNVNAVRPKSIWGHIQEPFHFARAFMASFDMSAVLRQGGFISLGRPDRAINVLYKTLWNSIRSERGADKLQQEIFNRKNAWMYDKGELFLHREDKLSNREESYMSKWIEKVPVMGHAFKASERAYTAFLNRLRADTFDALTATLAKKGEPTTEELKAIGNYINVATGRGNAGSLDSAFQNLSTIFFAPRYVLSRFQLAVGQPLWGGTARTRKIVAKEYAKYAIAMSLVYATAQAAWGDKEDFKIDFDPNSPDAGKIRIGRRTLIDPLSGLSQTFRMLWFTGHGTYATATGQEQPFGKNALDQATRFVRTKLAPGPQLVANLMSGKDAVGQPLDLYGQTVGSVFPPLSMRDIKAAFKEEGAPDATALSALSLLGAGVQIYGPPKEINIVPGNNGISVLDNDGNPVVGPFTTRPQISKWLQSNGYKRQESGKFEASGEAKQSYKDLQQRKETRKAEIKSARESNGV